MLSGPFHRTNSSGSVCALKSCSGVAAKSRVNRMPGMVGSASMRAVVMRSSVVWCCS